MLCHQKQFALFASMLDDHSRTMFTIRAEPISCLEPNPACQDCQDSSVSLDYDEAFEAGEHSPEAFFLLWS